MTRGNVISNDAYLAKEEKVLQDMTDKLIEIGGCYRMEMYKVVQI